MKRALGLLGLGLAALIAGLVWQLPAGQALDWVPAERRPQLDGVSGTVSAGRVASIRQGKWTVGPLNWSLNPWSLLWLHPSAELELKQPVLARGQLRASPTGALRLHGWQATATVTDLLAAAGYKFLPLTGAAGLQLDNLDLVQQRPSAIHGRLELRNLVWAMGSQQLPVGDVEAVLSPVDGIETAQVRDLGGPLEIIGTATLEPDGRYALDLKVKARADADPRLANLMRGLGRPDSQAYYPVRYSGTLQP